MLPLDRRWWQADMLLAGVSSLRHLRKVNCIYLILNQRLQPRSRHTNWTDLNKSTQLYQALIDHARSPQRTRSHSSWTAVYRAMWTRFHGRAIPTISWSSWQNCSSWVNLICIYRWSVIKLTTISSIVRAVNVNEVDAKSFLVRLHQSRWTSTGR